MKIGFGKILFCSFAVVCAGLLLAFGLFFPQTEAEELQAYRYEKNGEVTYVSRTDAEHIQESGQFSYADNELIVQLADGVSEEEAVRLA